MMENIKRIVEENNNDLGQIKKKLKSIASVKCRLLKQKGRKDYEVKLTEVLKTEQLLKEAKNYLDPKEVTIVDIKQEDVEKLTYDETIKAIKTIQSKKCNTQYDLDLTAHKKAILTESWLIEHKKNNKPIEDTKISKKKIVDLLENIEQQKEIDKNWILEQLKNLL